MAAYDIGAYDIGVIDIYDGFSLFDAADAERIVAATGKQPRHDSRKTAEMLNWAISLAIMDTSAALAAPASRQRARAKRLESVLGQALQLMGFSIQPPFPAGGGLASACAVLLPGGERAPLAAFCAKLGFSSTEDAIGRGIAAMQFFQICAICAQGYWNARPEKTKHKRDPFVMAWATTMVNTFVNVVDAERTKFPTTESPLIRFCEAMRVHLLGHAGPPNHPPLQAFHATLKRVRPASMAAFISRHLSGEPLSGDPQRIRRSTRSNSHRRISRQRRPK